MKYTFEITTREDENVIKLEIAYGSASNAVSRTLTFEAGKDDDNPNLNNLLNELIDNMRLTVKEREDAYYNADVFKSYLMSVQHEDKPKMIVENGDPTVVNKYEL